MPRPTMDSDPAGLVGAISTAVGAILALAVAFGVDLTATQTEAILAVVATVGPIVIAFTIRRRAWAPDAHATDVNLNRTREADR